MRNVPAARRSLLTLGIAAAVFTLGGPAPVADADSAGTLQVNSTFVIKFNPGECPAGTPTTTNCFRESGGGSVAGLGVMSAAYTLMFDDFGTACGHVHAQIPIVVAGKGEIDLATSSTGCITADAPTRFPPSDVRVSGGSGRYAGASGSGVLSYENHETGGGSGRHIITWTGALNVPGLTFDTTPPQLTGARSRTVKTRAAGRTRVRYSVTAADATDGSVHAACLPASGTRFRVGRTVVKCKAVDSSGNTTTASFVITVKRVRH